MATHMFRHLRRSSFTFNLLRRQNIRLVSSCGPRIVFAANKYAQQPYLLRSSLLARPASVLGVRLFGDAGSKVSLEDIQTRALNVVKLFDKVDAEKVRFLECFIMSFAVLDFQLYHYDSNSFADPNHVRVKYYF